jgi:uncharacterized protein YndB with AHSA1/START domain
MPSPSTTKAVESVVETEISTDTVKATVLVAASLERLWEAITRREVVSMWFGDLSENIAAGKTMRLDFGDGDFFAIENVRSTHPTRLEYSWRFLGTGARDSIVWKLVDQGDKSMVTVTDREPSRSEKSCVELAEGWTDFLERLEKYLRTGDLTRYDWRRDFDGSIELPVSKAEATSVLSALRGRFLWVPWEKVLTAEPLAIDSLEWKGPACVEFQVKAAGWKHTTDCRLEIVSKPQSNSAIVVRHTGWENISDDPVFCMTERRRFCDQWIVALKETQALFRPTVL